MDQKKTVPPANELVATPLDGSSTMGLAKPPPGVHWEYASPDPKHPSYIGNFLKPKTFPNGKTRAPYEVVKAPEADPWLSQLRQRADQGQAVDTKVYNGDSILVQTTKENAALYDESLEAHNLELDKTLKNTKSRSGRVGISEGTVTAGRGGPAPRPIDVAGIR